MNTLLNDNVDDDRLLVQFHAAVTFLTKKQILNGPTPHFWTVTHKLGIT